MGTMMKKTSKGRRKIEMKKIDNLSSRQVTFSKRRLGLFKKASELCILTGAQVAIVVNSLSSNRVYSFGHLSGGAGGPEILETPMVSEYNRHYSEICKMIDAEKQKAKMMSGGGLWWEKSSVQEMGEYAAALEDMGKAIALKAEEVMHSRSLIMPVEAPPCSFTSAFVNQYFPDQQFDMTGLPSGFDQTDILELIRV